MQNSSYRADVFSVSNDLNGGITQLLTQKDKLYKDYATLRMNTKISFEALNIRGVLLVGNYSEIPGKAKSCFELFRNELRSIEIICFDELLAKIILMLSLFEDKGTKPLSFYEDGDIPF